MKTILLIEDVELVRKLACIVLAREGYTILTASSAVEAQELWNQKHDQIEVVITDNVLPDGSGIELAKTFERQKPGLKVIVASGGGHTDLPSRYFQLHKPFDSKFLLAFVKGALSQN